jgi:hypothetical protein
VKVAVVEVEVARLGLDCLRRRGCFFDAHEFTI